MVEKQIKQSYHPIIYYGSESVDITKYCCQFLLKYDFHQNSAIENIFLLEKALEVYSIQKFINWGLKTKQPIPLNHIESFMNLPDVMKMLDENIPTENEKRSFFIQYIHCILCILEQINQTGYMTEEEEKAIEEYITIEKDYNSTINIIPNANIPIYQIPYQILNHIKKLYLPREEKVMFKK